MYSEHLKNKKNMHVGDILGFILGVIRVKNQLKTKYFTGPFLRNDNSLLLQCKISAFFHGFLQVLDCGDSMGPSNYLENDFLSFVNICYGPQIHFRPFKAKKFDPENRNGAKLAIYPKIKGKWGK